MLCIVATITGFGVLFLLTKTIVLVFYKPVQVMDLEHQEDGMTVRVYIVIYNQMYTPKSSRTYGGDTCVVHVRITVNYCE